MCGYVGTASEKVIVTAKAASRLPEVTKCVRLGSNTESYMLLGMCRRLNYAIKESASSVEELQDNLPLDLGPESTLPLCTCRRPGGTMKE